MTQDDIPPVKPRPRVAFTWWWALGAAVIAGAAVGSLGFHGPAKHDPAGLNTVEMTHAQPG